MVSFSLSDLFLNRSGQAKPLFFQKGLFSIGQGKKFSFKKQLSEFTKVSTFLPLFLPFSWFYDFFSISQKVGLGPIIAGTIASVATLQFSATFLEVWSRKFSYSFLRRHRNSINPSYSLFWCQQLESVPLLPQFEIFVGTLFSLNLAYSFLRGGEGKKVNSSLQMKYFTPAVFPPNLLSFSPFFTTVRARIESLMESAMDGIEGLKGSEDQLIEEPSMLEVGENWDLEDFSWVDILLPFWFSSWNWRILLTHTFNFKR